MSKRSAWKNTAEGKTIKRNSVAQYFTSRPVELIASPALRILSRAGHLALLRIELELRQHAGRCNEKLIVTKEQFVEFGLHPRMVAPALRELEALGIIRIEHGRGGNAEHRQPNRFLLNYLCGAVDADEQITNAWRLFKTMDEAVEVRRTARKAKDPQKVAYSRRTAGKRNNFRGHKVYPKPGTQSAPEIQNFRVHKVYLQGRVHKVYLLLISRVVVGMWSVVFESVPTPSPPGLRQCSRRCLVPSVTSC